MGRNELARGIGSMSRWWRAYDEALDDPKLQRLSADLFRCWFNLLCLTSKNGGTLPQLADISFALRIPEARMKKIMNELRLGGLIDETADGTLHPHNWNGRQYKSDVSTERVKQFRKRKRNVSSNGDGNGDETFHETEPDGFMKRSRSVSVSSLPSSEDSLRLEALEEEKACGKFTQFWKIYPHKVGKKDAEKAFGKAKKTVDFETLMAGLRAYAAKTDDRPWCNPATWLNQGRWDDQPAEPTRGGALGVLERIQRTLESGADSDAGEGVVVSLPQGRLSGC